MTNVRYIDINTENIKLLKDFVDSLISEKTTFRYFEKRELSIISNHIVTLLMNVDDHTVGYGHLDKDGDKIWLGIVINKNFQGKGYGSALLKELIARANSFNINMLYLTVDSDNPVAESMYIKNGFTKVSSENNHHLYKLILSK